MSFYIADEVQSTESAIISSNPTSVSGIIVLLNTKHWIKISRTLMYFLSTRIFGHFEGKFSVIKFQFPYLDKLQDIRFIL